MAQSTPHPPAMTTTALTNTSSPIAPDLLADATTDSTTDLITDGHSMNAPLQRSSSDDDGARRATDKNASTDKNALRVVIVGHVDHGKSTLTGRLIHDSGSLPDGKLDALKKSCERRGVPFEWAFLMDAFQSERDQNVTIDTAQIFFSSKIRPYVIIDAPGHREFLKNMVTGAAQADTALLLVAADEGVKDQSRRHGTLLSMLGVKDVIVVVNKMDRVGFSEEVFNAVKKEFTEFLNGLGVTPRTFVPVSARDGDNIVHASSRSPFYKGRTVLELLDDTAAPAHAVDGPVVFPIQDIYRFDHRRIIAGRLESGTLSVGDTITFFPGGRTSKVKTIEAWSKPTTDVARAGASIGITLEEQIFVERGQVAVRSGRDPVAVSRTHKARLFWLGRRPLEVNQRIRVKLATADVEARITEISRVLDASTLDSHQKTRIERDDVAEVVIETKAPLAVLDAHISPALGRFVIVDGYDVAGGGLLVDVNAETAREDLVIAHTRRHRGCIVAVANDVALVARSLETSGIEVVRLDDDALNFPTKDRATVRALARALVAQGFVVLGDATVFSEDDVHQCQSADVAELERLHARLANIKPDHAGVTP